jgi:flagellar motor switch/type III secretory pathway protein FliN
MKMAHDFMAARLVAQHCDELLKRGPRPGERASLLAAWRRDLAQALADDLTGLLSGDRLDVIIGEPESLSGDAALMRIGPVAANCLLRVGALGGTSTETVLLSADFATAIALTDRSFGGDGKLGGGVPEQLPRSAALLIEEAAKMIAQAITRVSYGDAPEPLAPVVRGEVIVRSESAGRLKPFDVDAPCLLFAITIANRQGCEWRLTLAMAAERLARLLPGAGRPLPLRTARAPADGMAAPFANIPLPLHVVVAEIELSLARLQALVPGDCFPLALGRQVPLMVGERVLAHGSIGTSEDRMAIRLARLPESAPVISPALPAKALPEGVAP